MVRARRRQKEKRGRKREEDRFFCVLCANCDNNKPGQGGLKKQPTNSFLFSLLYRTLFL